MTALGPPTGMRPPEMRRALGKLGLMLKAGEPVPPQWVAWLAEALIKIGHDVEATRALGLAARVGRPAKTTAADIAFEMGLPGSPARPSEFDRDGPKRPPTQEEAAEKLDVSTRSIQRKSAKWRRRVEDERESWEESGP